jgi:cellulose synthase/poly-beta-1,6-N-acetylglucosamine synthase-like glycosyltransferase
VIRVANPRDSGAGETGRGRTPAGRGFAQVEFHDWQALIGHLNALDDGRLRDVLRQRYVPVELADGTAGCIVTDKGSYAAAIRQGRRIAGWTRQSDLVKALQAAFGERLVHSAARRLAVNMPMLSAERQLTIAQSLAGVVILQIVLAGVWFAPQTTFAVIAVICSMLFLCVAAVRAASLLHKSKPVLMLATMRDEDLPVYTVIVPLFREVAVVEQLVAALMALDYPETKLDIKLVLEQEDIATRRAVSALTLPHHFELLVVPKTLPQTKPKALNYALQFARGELLAIYDAEDIPDPGQLRQAANTFAQAPFSLACLQARLAYYNSNENWLTRQFAIEYSALFDLMLPMLAHGNLPLPLGGTSNHFRTDVLRRVGGWDAHNVTEDADLGLRLARFGWRVGVIDSTTHEEANCRLDNWLQQRARWLKGWMQTWLVHMRAPARACRELGVWRFIVAQVLMLGMVVTALLHPVFLGFAVWAVSSGAAFSATTMMSSMLVGTGLVVLVTGYGFAIAAGAQGVVNRGLKPLRWSLFGMPVYWLLVSAGGWLALWQFIANPHYWNKTRHGLSRLMTQKAPD